MSEEETLNTTQSPAAASDEKEQQVKSTEISESDIQNTVETEQPQQIEQSGYSSDLWITSAPDASDATLSNALQQHSIQLDEQNNNTQEERASSVTVEPPTPDTVAVVDETPNELEKPAVGSPAWHKLRRENHKQVERRRRETINEGINEIARIVPGCEKNKGSILQRAAVYIRQLKEAEAATVEKWTLEKLLTDQAISELNRQVEVLKSELDRVRLENEFLKRQRDSSRALEDDQEPEYKKQKIEQID